jgi:hypothetical protein
VGVDGLGRLLVLVLADVLLQSLLFPHALSFAFISLALSLPLQMVMTLLLGSFLIHAFAVLNLTTLPEK